MALPADPGGALGRRQPGEPNTAGAPDEGTGPRGGDAQTLQAGHDEEERKGVAHTGLGKLGLFGRRSRPAVGLRHHASAHLVGMAVSRRGARRVGPADRRLGDGASHAGRIGRHRTDDGGHLPPAEGTGDPPTRPRLTTRRWPSGSGAERRASCNRWARWATRVTTRWARAFPRRTRGISGIDANISPVAIHMGMACYAWWLFAVCRMLPGQRSRTGQQ